ncbi:MAG: YbaN family protein [Candidatus Bathyarchaeota archaeon]|nr:YbaN family protein [Candidatus Bathyarchaeota archaeon]
MVSEGAGMDKNAEVTATCKPQKNRLKRTIWFLAGTICVVLGAFGTVLPILPTTPFLLAAAACYCKSSERAYKWLLGNKWFGEYIRNYKEGKGLPVKTKVTTLSVLWGTIGASTVFALPMLLPEMLVLPMQLAMIAVAIAVSLHILKLPTFKKE